MNVARGGVVALVVLAGASLPLPSAAQVALTGTFVRYVAVGANGAMIARRPTGESCAETFVCSDPSAECTFDTEECVVGSSMQYGETAAGTPSCDLYYPGSPIEGFTVEGTSGASTVVLSNLGDGFGDITTVSGPAVSGREITWSGDAMIGATRLRVVQTFSFASDDRVVRLAVTLTNMGTAAITDLYYLRNGDPDFGECNIGSDFETENDVRRQPPASSSALVTMRAGDPGMELVLGMGAFDERARVHAGGFENTDASGEWMAPEDPDGMRDDIGVDIVFREAMLAPAASTTFEIFYVWGQTVAQVEARFDDLGFPAAPCMGIAEGGACSASGAAGVCRMGRCCTGCWDGTRCVSGRSATACGASGAACASCADADACTSDVCTAGACSNPDAPMGTTCDDGLFCTTADVCDGAGACLGAGPPPCDDGASCTADSCAEATDTCDHTMIAGCIIGGSCVGMGTVNPSYPCQICDPDRDATDWSPVAVGTECGPPRCLAGRLTAPPTCDAAGACAPSGSMACPTGMCATTTLCEPACAPGGCPTGEYCAPTMRCLPQVADGTVCMGDAACTSGHCVDGVCCASVCDGVCEACDLPGMAGTCAPTAAGFDPEGECGGGACDGAGACTGGAMPDAGTPPPLDAAATPPDAGTTPGIDAGGTTPTPAGCGCRAARRDPGIAALSLLALVSLVLSRRRRR